LRVVIGSVAPWATVVLFTVNGLDAGNWGITALTLGVSAASLCRLCCSGDARLSMRGGWCRWLGRWRSPEWRAYVPAFLRGFARDLAGVQPLTLYQEMQSGGLSYRMYCFAKA
jgi:hypothetical protein